MKQHVALQPKPLMLRPIFEIAVELRIPQATAASMLAIFTFLVLDEPPAAAVIAAIAGATSFLYCLDSLLDQRHFHRVRAVSTRALLAMCISGGMIAIVATIQLPLGAFLLVCTGIIPCALYSVPLARHRLKDYMWIKMFLVPGAIVTAVIMLPVIVTGSPVSAALPIFLALLPLVGATVIASDLRDFTDDRYCQIPTLPRYLGKGAARRLASLLGLGSLPLSLLLLPQGSWIGFTLACISLQLGMKDRLTPTGRTIFIDGALAFPAVVLFLVQMWTRS